MTACAEKSGTLFTMHFGTTVSAHAHKCHQYQIKQCCLAECGQTEQAACLTAVCSVVSENMWNMCVCIFCRVPEYCPFSNNNSIKCSQHKRLLLFYLIYWHYLQLKQELRQAEFKQSFTLLFCIKQNLCLHTGLRGKQDLMSSSVNKRSRLKINWLLSSD